MRTRAFVFALGLLLAAAAVVGIVLGARSTSPRAKADTVITGGAATVQRRDLVEADTESGTLSYANAQIVYNRLRGTITWLPVVGQVVHPGQPLFDVDGQPVILMDGSTPAYRDLRSSDTAGQDVLEVNRNLVRLGFNPDGIVIDDVWQAATTDGVDALQSALGETETGSLSLGKVVFLPGDQLVSAVSGTLGDAVSDPAPTSALEFVDLTTTKSTNPTSANKPAKAGKPRKRRPRSTSGKSNKTLQALTALLQAEIAELKAQKASTSGEGQKRSSSGGSGSSSKSSSKSPGKSSGNSSGSSARSGNSGGGGSAAAILGTTSTRLVVTVDLDATKQSEARVGEAVTVEMPGGNTVNGRVSAVSPVAQSSSNNGNGNGNNGNGNGNGNGSGSGSGGATIPVTIALSGRQAGAGLDQASVSVNFAEAKANNVLSVPVTALLAQAGGGYAVQEAASPHALIPVSTGLFAAGYVEISGRGIYPGLAVTDSQG